MRRFFVLGVFCFVLIALVFGQTVVNGKAYFTAQDLAKYAKGSPNGHYVAIDSVVYDMTNVPAWGSGGHQGGTAGEDISAKIVNAPHGKNPVPNLPIKGYLVGTFTLAELSRYDGTKNMPKYVAASGVVYDVSSVPAWRTGRHQGGRVGTDISSLIAKAPHGVNVLGNRDVVGFLVTAK